ncbi:hypothetical protein HAX54_033934, partial [Datura stramonium]|nr:hypothetical protein [Datura stramonium]
NLANKSVSDLIAGMVGSCLPSRAIEIEQHVYVVHYVDYAMNSLSIYSVQFEL